MRRFITLHPWGCALIHPTGRNILVPPPRPALIQATLPELPASLRHGQQHAYLCGPRPRFRSWYPLIAVNITIDFISILLCTCLTAALLSDVRLLRSQCRNLFYLNVVVSEGIWASFEFTKFVLLVCRNELLENRALQYADAAIVHMTAIVSIWTLAVVAVDLWLILCKRIKISDRAVVGACASGWIIGTVEAISILLDSTLTWAEIPLFAGSSWSSRNPLVLFRTILGWSCVFLSVGATGTAYYLIMRHITASKARLSQATKSSKQGQISAPQSQVDAGDQMCRRFMMLSIVSITCGTPTAAWVLCELLGGRTAPPALVVLATTCLLLEPTLDSLLIIYMHPNFYNRILSWFKLVRPARAENIATSP
ncbi:hypothetical protein SeLEV6574_g01704 [Synchytrium endobioticum]|uniref:G-protein coupled receptors family 1 profile domain-containing protein n=1 Tax=Synchytrium endobioticum TaxID=286115 RepID=A0A507DBF4_9FUNG|nr:hypothetical protein SeLEV6574_g01704 [Synchytrium endobioticum]